MAKEDDNTAIGLPVVGSPGQKRWKPLDETPGEITKVHPCFNEIAHDRVARLHLPVAPKCNTRCRFCGRGIKEKPQQPGQAKRTMNAQEALEHTRKMAEEMPELRIVGVAGPGDPLANMATLETFELLNTEEFKNFIKCVSTNGINLPKYAQRLYDIGVRALTVTVNSLKPETAAQIYKFVLVDGKKYEGTEGAKIIIKNQLDGIELAAKLGMTIKVNTVLIPGLNDNEMEDIARETSERGATMMNIMPLIPAHDFAERRAPTCKELDAARAKADKYLAQFRVCKQCTADARGIPGRERGYQDLLRCPSGG
jgi:nitrogen fixation protein NifB